MKKTMSIIYFLLFSFVSYASEKNYLFIDISGSVDKNFNKMQNYICNEYISNLPSETELAIYKFYGKLNKQPIFEGRLSEASSRDYAKKRVNELIANGPWTNITNVCKYINDLEKKNGEKFLIYTDGHQELEDGSNNFHLDDKLLNSLLDENAKLTKQNNWIIIEYIYNPSSTINYEEKIETNEDIIEISISQENKTTIIWKILLLGLIAISIFVLLFFYIKLHKKPSNNEEPDENKLEQNESDNNNPDDDPPPPDDKLEKLRKEQLIANPLNLNKQKLAQYINEKIDENNYELWYILNNQRQYEKTKYKTFDINKKIHHLQENDSNALNHPELFEDRIIKNKKGKFFSVKSPNFKYLVEIQLPANLILKPSIESNKSFENRQFAFCTNELVKRTDLLNKLCLFDRTYVEETECQPYDTVWHHDIEPGRMLLVSCQDHNISKGGVPHTGGAALWPKIINSLF